MSVYDSSDLELVDSFSTILANLNISETETYLKELIANAKSLVEKNELIDSLAVLKEISK